MSTEEKGEGKGEKEEITDEEVLSDSFFVYGYKHLLNQTKEAIRQHKEFVRKAEEKSKKIALAMDKPYYHKIRSIPENDRKFVKFIVRTTHDDNDNTMSVIFNEGLTGRQILEQMDPHNDLKLTFENPRFENVVFQISEISGIYYVLNEISEETFNKLHDEYAIGYISSKPGHDLGD